MSRGAERTIDADVGIVGAGPGGMAAAVELARAGLAVAVLDEGFRAGGQIFRQQAEGLAAVGRLPEPPSHEEGHALVHELEDAPVQVVHGATVWDARPGRLWFEREGRSWLLRCQRILLAPGAYDRCVPFPGWTLPGVVTAGAAQVMVRGFGLRPGTRALVAGSGPLLLPTVTALASAGVDVVEALEAAPRSAMLKALPGVVGNAARRREALYYLKALLRSGKRLRWGWTVFGVEGDGRVQRATIGRVDASGAPIRSSARTVEVDLVCAGFGLVPAVELAALLGCELEWSPVRGGWTVKVDERQATTVAGVHAAGEIAGIGGAEVAMAQGRLAAAAIVEAVHGRAVPQRVRARARAERRAADAMLRAFPVREGWFALADAGTVVCRCEDVTFARLQQAAAVHGTDGRGIKMGCRAGMGPCQGRICGPSLQALACRATNTPCSGAPMDRPSVQMPVKPVRTATFLDAPRG